MPFLWRQFSAIPDMAWSLDTNDQGYSVAVIACPCGRQPVIEIGNFDCCDQEYNDAIEADDPPPEGACPRFYLFTGSAVYIANSPHRAPQST